MALRDLIRSVDDILPTLHESVRTEVGLRPLRGLFPYPDLKALRPAPAVEKTIFHSGKIFSDQRPADARFI